jgi:hypothetical protein
MLSFIICSSIFGGYISNTIPALRNNVARAEDEEAKIREGRMWITCPKTGWIDRQNYRIHSEKRKYL